MKIFSFLVVALRFCYSVLSNEDRRRLEEKIRRLEEELEEEQAVNETTNDKCRKAQVQVRKQDDKRNVI